MADRDRDWRNGGIGRSGPAPTPRRAKPVRIGRVLVLAACLVVAYLVGQRQGLIGPDPAESSPAESRRKLSLWPATACGDPFPVAGTLVAQPQWQRSASATSVTTFANRTAADRVVDLLDGERLLASIAVPANASAVVDLPVGAHRWRLRAGAAWCRQGWRFVREQRTRIADPLEIVASSQLTVDISPDPDHPTGFALSTRDVPTVSSIGTGPSSAAVRKQGGTLLVPRSANGHYFVDGSIDGEPVRFLIDTGASRIAVPVTLARRLGYYEGREVTVNTANGRVAASEFKLRRITFGPFAAEDVTAVAMMDLDTPLLGMSLLQSIELRQTAAGLEMRQTR